MKDTIIDLFRHSAAACRDNTAFNYFTDQWQHVSYKEFGDSVDRFASYLLGAGAKKGDRIAIISENRQEWCIAYLSVLASGCIAVPLDAQLGPPEVRILLDDSGAGIVFHSDKTAPQLSEFMEGFSGGAQKTPLFINFDSKEYRAALTTNISATFPQCSSQDTVSIIYTSGTTGNPKGVVLTNRNFCSDAQALIDAGIVSHEDNVLAILPLHHTYAFMCTFLVPVLVGGSITYSQSMKGPDMVAAINNNGVSVVVGVPQLLGLIRNGIMSKINAMPRFISFILNMLIFVSGSLRRGIGINLGMIIFGSIHRKFGPRFRFFTSGGARLDPEVMEGLEALGFTVLEGYGLTETSPVVTFNPFEKRKPGSAGRPLPSVEIRIAAPSRTAEGEIEIKGPMVMQGYYKNEAATAGVIHDGWFKTGDIGRIDNEGYLFITGRSKEVIVLGSGKNVYPEDAEKMYLQSRLIKELCIVGIEHNGVADALHAVIVPDFDHIKTASISNIQDAIKWEINDISGRIPSYMRVSGFTLRKEPLPRTPLGKLRRFMIKPEQQTSGRSGMPVSKTAASVDNISEGLFNSLKSISKDAKEIKMDDNLELDLGLDSLSKIELVVLLEKTFSLKLAEDFMNDIHTVSELDSKIRRFSGGPHKEGPAGTKWKDIIAVEPEQKIHLEEPGSLMFFSRAGHAALRTLLKIFFRLEARGRENLPPKGNYILAPNHTSYMDGFVVILALPFSFFRNIYALGIRDFFTGALRSRLADAAHVIPIDSSSYLNRALQTASYVLRHGRSLCIFPEGGRSPDGNLLEFKKGIGILAKEMTIPVIPVYIKGAYEALPRTALFPRFTRITVTFGRPLLAAETDFSTKPSDMDDYQYFASLIREKVNELSKQT